MNRLIKKINFKQVIELIISLILSYIYIKYCFKEAFFINNNSVLYLALAYFFYIFISTKKTREFLKAKVLFIYLILMIIQLIVFNQFFTYLGFYGISMFLLTDLIIIHYFYDFYTSNKKKLKVKTLIISLLLALAFTCFEHLGYTSEYSVKLFNELGNISYCIILIHIFLFFFITINHLFYYDFKEKTKISKVKVSKKELVIKWLIIIICYLPYYLKFYPGLLSYDSIKQIKECMGDLQYSNSHSLLHTMLIKISLIVTNNNVNLSIGIFTFLQMIFVAFVFAYICYFIKKKGAPRIFNILIFILFALTPYHAMYSITVWKDVLFAMVIPLLIIQYVNLIDDKEQFFSKKNNLILFSFTMLIAFLLRNNAIYAMIIAIPILFICYKKYWRKISLICGIPILTYLIFIKVISPSLNIIGALPREALSIPLQQIAAVTVYNYDSLTDKDKEKIEKFLDLKTIKTEYDMRLSDPVKATFNNNYYLNNKQEFFSLWLDLFNRNKQIYFRAFVYNSYGYYYPETSRYIVINNRNDEIYGIKHTPIIDNNIDEQKLIENIRNIPLISLLYSIGFMFWLNIIIAIYFVIKKKYNYLFINIMFLGLQLTLMASPVYAEFRYAYSIFTSMPILLFLMYREKVKSKEVNYVCR